MARRITQAVAVVAVTAVLLGALQLVAASTGRSMRVFTLDPATVAGLPWYTGVVSLLTGVLWCVGGALCLVATTGAGPHRRRRLGLLGALMILLGAEDLFTLQEALTALSIPAGAYYLAYLALGLAMAWQFRRRPYDEETVVFVAGGLLLGTSLATDLLGPAPLVLEDGAKLLGVLLWCLVPVWALRDRLHPAPVGATR